MSRNAAMIQPSVPASGPRFSVAQRSGLRGLALLLAVFALACAMGYVVVSQAVRRTVEQQALAVAEIVAQQATTARSVYSREIAGKLSKDGTGPHVDSTSMQGYVPIPAQFLKLVGRASSESSQRLYEYRPVSKWNIEPTQGLTDDFLRWAWPQLEAQETTDPKAPIGWRAVWRIEGEGAQRVLRYLSADAASQTSCATCHNAYERMPAILARRAADGVPSGKQWQQHQLLGALSVSIPLDKAEMLAGSQINQTTVFIFGILVSSFAAIAWFYRRVSQQQRSLHDAETQLARSEVEARSAAAQLEAQRGVEQAFAELSTYMQAIDQHAIVSVAGVDGRIVQVNDMMVTISGYSREELIGQDHRILSSRTHDRGFFADMWRTLRRGEIWRGTICNRNKAGHLYWVDSAIVPLKDAAGQVQRYVSVRMDITERMRAEADMRRIAMHDSLTGLVNRAVLRDRIDRALRSDRRTHHRAAVLFIDLDQFKTINDSLGHEVGDQLLVQVAQRLQANVREEDTVARQGGDEFIVFLPRIVEPGDAGGLAAKLVRELARPFRIGQRDLYIGSSIGVAVFPEHGEDVETLLKNSDTAMYHVKEAGRNHFAFFEAQMNSAAMERYSLGMELRNAASRGELLLHYQPVVDSTSGRIVGLEALLRWQHPDRGLVSPVQFIPLAESSGLIVPIGDWVLDAACAQIRAWREAGVPVPRVAVNLSARQLQQSGIVAQVQSVLQRHGLPATALAIEITKGSLLQRTDDAVATLRRFAALGVSVAIDDFGTGYSSLSYLKALPIDTLKIDRSFVMDIGSDADDTAIVAAILAMAHNLKLQVVAEGVETRAQLQYLRDQGCRRFQGFLASPPLPADKVAALLRRGRPLVATPAAEMA